MKRKIVSIMLMLAATFAASAQQRADQQQLTDPRSFSMILMGDPQGYTKYACN